MMLDLEFHLRGGTTMRIPDDGSGISRFVMYTLHQIEKGAPIVCKDPQGNVHAFVRPEDISGFQVIPRDPMMAEMKSLMERKLKAEAKHLENLSSGDEWKQGYEDDEDD